MLPAPSRKKLAIIGGGPSGLFLFKTLVDNYNLPLTVTIFEAHGKLGAGMPYSQAGANTEHITNVSGNEIPPLETTVSEWLEGAPRELLAQFNINGTCFSEYKVLPRLLFGEYLSAQFQMIIDRARKKGMDIGVKLSTKVIEIKPADGGMTLSVAGHTEEFSCDHVVICTGHLWPDLHEGKIKGYFDSPYPPSKLPKHTNHPVAVRGSSLTAIDAIRTLARHNGRFEGEDNLIYIPDEHSPNFKIVMHSRSGLLPAVRFHLADSHLSKASLLTEEQISAHILQNGGFLSLDYIFDMDFKEQIRKKDKTFYEKIKHFSIEEFVSSMMTDRLNVDPFAFFEGEMRQAEKSIERQRSIYWKEALAILSFAMNYPAKHLSAEDMQRLQHVLMPLISIVIAFVPQSSCRELIALHKANCLELIAVGDESQVEADSETGVIYHFRDELSDEIKKVHYRTYIDCVGQPHLSIEKFPFQGLVDSGSVSPARLAFRTLPPIGIPTDQVFFKDDCAYLKVSGLAITDSFRAIDINGDPHPSLHLMTVPFIGGYNPDYSGLDFCAAAAGLIVNDLITSAGDARKTQNT